MFPTVNEALHKPCIHKRYNVSKPLENNTKNCKIKKIEVYTKKSLRSKLIKKTCKLHIQ